MASLYISDPVDELEPFFVGEAVEQANQLIADKLQLAFDVLESGVSTTRTYAVDGTQVTEEYLPNSLAGWTGGARAILTGTNLSDAEYIPQFTISGLTVDLTSSDDPYNWDNPLFSIDLGLQLTVVDEHATSLLFSSFSIETGDIRVSLTGPVSWDDTTQLVDIPDGRFEISYDSDPSEQTVLSTLFFEGNLQYDEVADSVTGEITSMGVTNQSGHYLYGEDLGITVEQLENGTELLGGDSDTIYTTASGEMPAEFENVVVQGTRNISITGNSQNNQFTGNSGDNVFAGGGGTDTVIYSGDYSDYTLSQDTVTATLTISSVSDGVDTISGVELLQFQDQLLEVNRAPINNSPTGTVTISGTARTGQILTAANTLADADGLGAISYQWARDGVAIAGATNSTHVLTDSDVRSNLTVTASYTDGGGTVERVTSSATSAIEDIVKLIQIRNSETLIAKDASIEINGADYTGDSSDIILKFDLYLDAEGLDSINTNATEILGAEFRMAWDANQLDDVAAFASEENSNWLMDISFETGIFDLATSNNITGALALANATAVVDIDPSNDSGRSVIPMEQKIGTVYINPKQGVEELQLTLQEITVVTESGEALPLDYTVTLTTNQPPELLSGISDATLNEDSPYSYDTSNHFTDPDPVDVLTYSATDEDGSALPGWLSINSDTGVLSGTPLNGDVGPHAITVIATDLAGATVSDTFVITVNNSNDAPELSTPPADTFVNENSLFTHDASLHFHDDDTIHGDSLSYSAALEDGSALPAWLSINSGTGIITGTPGSEDTGLLSIHLTATDTSGASITALLGVTVNSIPEVAQPIADGSTYEDALYSRDLSQNFTDSDAGSTLTYEAALQDGSSLPSWLTLNAATGVISGTPLNEHVGDVVLAVTATDNWGASVTESYTITVNNTNDAPTGTVTITGDSRTGHFLTAQNDLQDDDGLGAITYLWSRDGVVLEGRTGATLLLADEDIGSTFTANASYLDAYGYAESVASSATPAVADIVKLIQIRNAEGVTAKEASIELNGTDYTSGSGDAVLKFELWFDAEGIDQLNTNATEIRGAEFDLGWDTGATDSVSPFATEMNESWLMDVAFESGAFSVATANSAERSVALGNATAVVDTDTSNDGERNPIPLEQKIGTFYLNPKEGVEEVLLTIEKMIIATDSGDTVPLDYTVELDATLVDAMIRVDESHHLNNATINYYLSDTDTGVSTLVEEGGIKIEESATFDAIKLAEDAYNFDINITDAIDVLRHIVNLDNLTTGSEGHHSADVNNDGTINISDAIDVLRHIVSLDTIDSFDLIDEQGNRVTRLDPDASGDTPTWTIVANGDVNLSGSFAEEYTIQSDLL